MNDLFGSDPGDHTIIKSGSGASIGGRNAKQNNQQGIQISVLYDEVGAKARAANCTKGKSIFPANGSQMFDVVPRRPVIRSSDLPNINPFGPSPVLSSLNGAGSELNELYPGDSEARRLAVKSKISFAGIAVGSHQMDSNGQKEFTVQIGGTTSVCFDSDIGPGQYVCIDVPNDTDIVNPSYSANPKNGEPAGKVSPLIVQYTPKSLGGLFQKTKELILKDKIKFDKAFSKNGGSSHLEKACTSIFEHQLSSVLIGMNILKRDGNAFFTTLVKYRPGNYTGMTEDEKLATDIALAGVALGLIQDNTVDMTKDLGLFSLKKQELLNAINWSGDTNTAFGNSLVGTGSSLLTSPAKNDSRFLQMAKRAFNDHKRVLVAYSTFIEEDRRHIIGICTKGARKGDFGEVCLKP